MRAGSAGVNGPRFYVNQPPDGDEMVLAGDTGHRIARVLRLPIESAVALFDGSGRSWPAEVIEVRGRSVRVAIGKPVTYPPEPATVLLAGMIRPNRFEWLVEKATELGATTIVPVVCARSTVRPAEIGPSRLERWRRIAIEASEQCGRVSVPPIEQPAAFEDALSTATGRFLVAAEPVHGPAVSLGAGLHDIAGEAVTLLVGPEGGLTEDEVQRSIEANGAAVTLGPRILRAETAAIAALSVLVDTRQRHTDLNRG
jgi:16S rRNA (uracil1498-N3)-methyltransferase